MNIKVRSGGQTGVDQAALRAARAVGFATQGDAPRGWLTEDGPAPWLADYGMNALEYGGYSDRTEINVYHGAGTIWIGDPKTPGGKCTARFCFQQNRPLTVLDIDVIDVPSARVLLDWVFDGCVVNVAGNRESKNPGIGVRAEAFLTELFRLLKGEPS